MTSHCVGYDRLGGTMKSGVEHLWLDPLDGRFSVAYDDVCHRNDKWDRVFIEILQKFVFKMMNSLAKKELLAEILSVTLLSR